MTSHQAEQRRLKILLKLSQTGGTNLSSARLCKVAAEVTDVSGAGIMLMSGDAPGTSICNTDRVSSLIEALQFSLGEGPCIDAYSQDQPVLEPDLVNPAVVRWAAFSGPAAQAGVRAVFGFPLQAGPARLGALGLYCNRPGPLSDEQHANAISVAQVAAQTILSIQSSMASDDLAPELDVASESRWVVHQAAGMVSVQLEVSVDEAMARLRAFAFSDNRPIFELAKDIVQRKFRFDEHYTK